MSEGLNEKTMAPQAEQKARLLVIMDKSGSMGPLADDVIGGFNELMDEQRKLPGECRVSVVMFDTSYNSFVTNELVELVPKLSKDNYQPGGMTALLDAVGRGLADLEAHAGDEKVVSVAIITDGCENSSKEHKRDTIKAAVERLQAKGWQFLYLGANVDAFAEASSFGIPVGSAAGFAATGKGTRGAYGVVGQTVTAYRTSGGTNDPAFTEEQREQMADNAKEEEEKRRLTWRK